MGPDQQTVLLFDSSHQQTRMTMDRSYRAVTPAA